MSISYVPKKSNGNSIKVFVVIISLLCSITATNYPDPPSSEQRRIGRNCCCDFFEKRARVVKSRDNCSVFNRRTCCGFFETQVRGLERRNRANNERVSSWISSVFKFF